MLKRERLSQISTLVAERGIVNVNDIAILLDVSDMTVRRDLDELERSGKLVRIHGGAQSLNYNSGNEDPAPTRIVENAEQKTEIALTARALLHDQDVVFLGSGTTIELLAQNIDKDITIVTNSYPVFEILSKRAPEKVLLTGGLLHEKSGAFVGTITNNILKTMKFSSAFISCSALKGEELMISSMEEGEIQKTVLKNSRKTYLLVDADKFNQEDFYIFGSLKDVTSIVSDSTLNKDVEEKYEDYTDIIKKGSFDIVSAITPI